MNPESKEQEVEYVHIPESREIYAVPIIIELSGDIIREKGEESIHNSDDWEYHDGDIEIHILSPQLVIGWERSVQLQSPLYGPYLDHIKTLDRMCQIRAIHSVYVPNEGKTSCSGLSYGKPNWSRISQHDVIIDSSFSVIDDPCEDIKRALSNLIRYRTPDNKETDQQSPVVDIILSKVRNMLYEYRSRVLVFGEVKPGHRIKFELGGDDLYDLSSNWS